MSRRKPRVVIFFGGDAGSCDLSEESGYWACQYLPRTLYEIIPVRVNHNGDWQVPLGSLPQRGPVARMMNNIFKAVPVLPAASGIERLLRKPVDLLLTFVRGVGGDDGSLHGMGRALSIPVAGSSLPVCQQTSDKYMCAQRLKDIVESPAMKRFKKTAKPEEVVETVRGLYVPPLFVKPVYAEASVGVEEVNSIDELGAAVKRAQQAGDVLIQKKAVGTEINVTLFSDIKGRIHRLPPTVVVPQRATFYDHLAKRRPGRVTLNTPVSTDNEVLKRVKALANDIYDDLGCEGVVSFDFSVDDKKMQLLEVNTVPTISAMTPLIQQLRVGRVHPGHLLGQQIDRHLKRS